ncbi:hypothetical protein F5Y06DRAFT_294366 [Hypoxylon sp. FL0890]|nr:hypothetical protein F5Y06DRAFT_294366 [Hypoxylon sp. FL0890]
MGANQSTQEELEFGRLGGLGSGNGSPGELARFTDGARRTEPALEDRADNGLEAEPSIESNNGFERADSPVSHQEPDSLHGLSIYHTLEKSCDLEDAVSITRGQDTGGLRLEQPRQIEQAASKDARPQSEKGMWTRPSRTQSPISGCSILENISNLPNNNNNNLADPPSLHLLHSRPSQYTALSRLAIITTLQKRPGINFDLHKNNLSKMAPKKATVAQPRKREAAAEAAKAPAPKRAKVAKGASQPEEQAKAKGASQPKQQAIAKAAPQAKRQVKQKEDPNESSGEDEAAESEAGNRVLSKRAKNSMADRLRTNSKAILHQARHEAVNEYLKDKPDDAQRIADKAKAIYYEKIKEYIAGDAAKEEMGAYWKEHTEPNLDFSFGLQDDMKKGAKPATKKGVTKKAVAEKPASDKSASDKPAADKPAANKPVAKKPVIKKGIARPVVKKGKKCKTSQHDTQNDDQHTNVNRGLQSCTSPDTPSLGSGLGTGDESLREDCIDCVDFAGVVVETRHKWAYLLYEATGIKSHSHYVDFHEHATLLPGYFVDRDEANAKLLEITNYDQFEGGMAAVTRRHVYEHTPLKLLKVELSLATGEDRVLWVERHLVDLKTDLTKKERSLKKWSAKRPALPHYIVECEFMNRKTTETPQRLSDEDRVNDENDDDDDVAARAMSAEVVGAFSGEIELERLPLVTFTDRGLANEHAGALFLRHSAVREAIRGPLDDYWWVNNAVTIHREAEKAATAPDALYAAEMYTMDMNTRLGFDWIRVAVYAVDDVLGPLNI